MKPPTSIAWENGPTGGASSGEVIAVLLMADSFGYWVGWSGWWSRGCARFQCLVGAGRSHITRRVHAQGTHDSRSATIGSTLVARQAGMQLAAIATTSRSKGTIKNTAGSYGRTP